MTATGQRSVLPEGWSSFRSNPDRTIPAHWYAASPYPVDALKAEYGKAAHPLCHTVAGESWEELCAEVAAQVSLYEGLASGGDHAAAS
ncbi:hypothetical protein ACWDBD_02140 [Streptomyces sp. NPDC001118]